MTPALPQPLRIIGYSDRPSALPGETMSFAVSGAGGGRWRGSVHRLLGGGSDPTAPALRSNLVEELGEFALLDQAVAQGSHARAVWDVPLGASVSLALTIQPRLSGRRQTVVWLGGTDDQGVAVELAENGALQIVEGDRPIAAADTALPLFTWSRLTFSVIDTIASLAWEGSATGRIDVPLTAAAPLMSRLFLAARPHEGAQHLGFWGRIESPRVHTGVFEHPVTSWDFSRDIPEWSVPGEGSAPVPLTLHEAPVRGVRGSRWTDATDWRAAPEQYGAIHFHGDALEDCGWESQVTWSVPEDARSGFYALRVETDTCAADWIPFFVRRSVGAPSADVLVIASTATYAAYSNSRFWWEDPVQEIAQDRLVELGPEEQYLVTHPELGLSNYDRHLDGSPVTFSSWRRPNLFMRPGHSRAESYSSDLYLIAWLEHHRIAYDVATDQDLHFDGEALLAPYPAVISGSHPEYLSVEMYDATAHWVESGGRYLYLGGNGFTSCVTWRSDRPWLMENRTTGDNQNDETTIATESVHQLDGSLGQQMADSGRSPGSLWGVDSVTMGFDRSYPVLRSEASYAPELAWIFTGIEPRLFGGRSLSGGGVIGQEWDNARHMAGSPGHHVLASTLDTSLIPDILGAEAAHHGDVTAFFRGDGLVVAVGSMAWVGALHIDDYDNDAARFVRNVVARFIDRSPIPQPASRTQEVPA